MLPDEITRPPVERFSADAPEFIIPRDEFFHGEAPPEAPKRKRKLMQLAAGAIAAAVVIGTYANRPAEPAKVPEEPVAVTIPAPSPTAPSELPTEPVTEATVPPTTEEAEHSFVPEILESYENPSDTCIITVYGDLFDFEIFGNPILMEVTVQESTFTELELPEVPVYEGYSVIGYVMDYGPYSADFQSTGYNPGSRPFAADVGHSLTIDELRLVPVSQEDHIRHVFIHPVWVANEGTNSWEYAPVVTLDSGDNVIDFPIDLPLVSGGTFYVCAMEPEREGYIFAGWYNEAGERVYSVLAEDLFTTRLEGSDAIDWKKPTNITLTARWLPNS